MRPNDIKKILERLENGEKEITPEMTKQEQVSFILAKYILLGAGFAVSYYAYNWVGPKMRLPRLGVLEFGGLVWVCRYLLNSKAFTDD